MIRFRTFLAIVTIFGLIVFLISRAPQQEFERTALPSVSRPDVEAPKFSRDLAAADTDEALSRARPEMAAAIRALIDIEKSVLRVANDGDVAIEKKLIWLVQRVLKKLRYDPGPLDGKLGPRTVSAIESYQRDYDLAADGRPSRELLHHMKDELRSSGQSRDNLAGTYNNRGIAYADQGVNDRAIRDYDEAIRLNPSYAHAYYNRGLAHLKKGDQDLAARDYNQAVRLDLGYADVPYSEALTAQKPQSNPSTTSSLPATQALETAPAGVSETGQRSFAIQLASLRTRDGAEIEWKRLQRLFPDLLAGRDLVIQIVELEARGTFFRVFAGTFEDRTDAQDLCAEFKALEKYCMVIRLTDAH